MKRSKMQTKALACLAVGILLLISSACSRGGGEEPVRPAGTFPVDPLFADFYEALGGEPVLGPAISPLFQNGGSRYQYTTAALMEFAPQALETQQRRLAPIGNDMGLFDLPVPPPQEPDALYLNGHVVYKDFVDLFNRLGGLSYAGKPLTEVRHNLEKRRFEQYFENVGMYRLEDAPPEDVRLLSYGSWKCQESCPFEPPAEGAVVLPSMSAAPFIQTVFRLGTDFTGLALTVPYLSQDGHVEQIYENVVMVANPEAPDRVSLRPLPVRLGINPEPLETPSLDPNFTFFEIEPGRGYNVPNHFIDYILKHGGQEVAGVPIGRYTNLGSGIFRQCFANVCLEERPDLPPGQQVRPSPLGYSYRDIFYQTAAEGQGERLGVSMQIWDSTPMDEANQAQEIGVSVFGNGNPLPNLTPMLTLTLPDGVAKSYTMPPTDQNGQSKLLLEPLPVESGSLVPYQICVTVQGQQKYCVRDSVLILNTVQQVENRQYMPILLNLFFSDNLNRQFLPFIFHQP
jgi:hypothetical protein